MKYRQVARRLSLSKRCMALTAQEKVLSNRLYSIMLITGVKMKNSRHDREKYRKLRKVYTLLTLRYLEIVLEPNIMIERPKRLDKTIDSFTETQCWTYFKIRKTDLPRLLIGLRIPDEVVLENGSKLRGEEVMLRGLFELCTGHSQYSIADNIFGRDFSQQSRATKWFIHHVYSTFLFLVTNNLQWWWDQGYLHESMEYIKQKCEWEKWNPDAPFRIMGFIDCNCMETARVGSGPSEEGPNSTRWSKTIQQAFYNGWKSIHGLKHQTFDTAHGFTVDLFGPTSLRRNDLRLLGLSQLLGRLRDLQRDEEHKLCMFGDSIYPHLDVLFTYYKGAHLTPTQTSENIKYKSVRISIEWNYMTTASIFNYMANLDKLKVLGSRNVSRVYTVCTILRNCHVGLYGSQSSSYFSLPIHNDFLESYLRVDNIEE